MAYIEAIDMAEADANAEDLPIVAAQQDGGLVDDKRAAWLAEAKHDALIEEAKDFAERMTGQPWACELVERLMAALTASRAECEGLRVEHSQRAGKLEVALRRMLNEHDILSGNYNDGSRIKPDRWPDAASAARAALHKDPVIHNFGAALSQKETGA